MKLRNVFLRIEYWINYLRWCVRFPRLLAHRCYIGAGSRLYIGSRARIHFGRRVCFTYRFTGDFYGKVVIGDRVFFQHDCHISVHEELTIGDYCQFGEGVSIHDEDHIFTASSDPVEDHFVVKPISIGRNVLVGAKATILSGVHIGDNAVIGAHAVVTHDVPAYTVVGGVPAHVIREIKPSAESVARSMKINADTFPLIASR